MKTNSVAKGGRAGPWARFFGMASVAILARFASTEVHESVHFLVGRLAGLPANFLTLISVGVEASVAAGAPQYALALMNGVAPVMTVLLGILALKAVAAVRSKAPAALTGFLAWWAITGIPYMGLQLMTAAGPIRLRGDGSDSAAVIGGYLGAGIVVRSVISLAGLLLYLASGFWLDAAVAGRDDAARLALRQKLCGLAAGSCIDPGIAIDCDDGGQRDVAGGRQRRRFALVASGDVGLVGNDGVRGAVARPRGTRGRDRWIFPGLLASAGLIAIGLLTHLFDFLIDGVTLTMPLLATAWMLMRKSSSLTGCESGPFENPSSRFETRPWRYIPVNGNFTATETPSDLSRDRSPCRVANHTYKANRGNRWNRSVYSLDGGAPGLREES
jgi:hypothetical protein